MQTLLVLLALLQPAQAPQSEPERVETEPPLPAEQPVEPGTALSGNGWRVRSPVPVRGFLGQFVLEGGWGPIETQRRELLALRIGDVDKRHNVERELDLLTGLWHAAGLETAEVTALRGDLRTINEKLWDIEDAIRDCERDGDFGDRFVELARAVYKTNDRRAATKRAINDALGSAIIEEKSYAAY